MSRDAPLAAAKARSRKKRIGSIGSFARSSQATNATRSAAPPTSEPTIAGLVQPSPLPLARRQRNQDEPDRHVQPEDPLPRDAVDDRSADERPHCDGKAGDPGPRSKGHAPP